MPINRAHVGRTSRLTEPLEVTRGDIRRFAAAIGDQNPLYTDPAVAQQHGHRDVIAPPTFLIGPSMSAFAPLIHDPDLQLDYSLVLHGEQAFDLHRAVVAGDRLDCTARIVDIGTAGRNEFVAVVTTFSGGGEPVVTSTNTVISRGTAGSAP